MLEFLEVLTLAENVNASVQEMGEFSSTQWCWKILPDQVVTLVFVQAQLEEMNIILQSISLREFVANKFILFENPDGVYIVHPSIVVVSSLCKPIPMSLNLPVAITYLWKNLLPSKVQVFSWRCLKDKLTTREQLARRGILIDRRDKVCVF